MLSRVYSLGRGTVTRVGFHLLGPEQRSQKGIPYFETDPSGTSQCGKHSCEVNGQLAFIRTVDQKQVSILFWGLPWGRTPPPTASATASYGEHKSLFSGPQKLKGLGNVSKIVRSFKVPGEALTQRHPGSANGNMVGTWVSGQLLARESPSKWE